MRLLLVLLSVLALLAETLSLQITSSGAITPINLSGTTTDTLYSSSSAGTYTVSSNTAATPLITLSGNAVLTVSNLTLSTLSTASLIKLYDSSILRLSNVIITGASITTTNVGVISIQNSLATDLVTLSISNIVVGNRAGFATIHVLTGRALITVDNFTLSSPGEPFAYFDAAAAFSNMTIKNGVSTSATATFLQTVNGAGNFFLSNILFSAATKTQLFWSKVSGTTISLDNIEISDSLSGALPLVLFATAVYSEVSIKSSRFNRNVNAVTTSTLAIVDLQALTAESVVVSNTTATQNNFAGGSFMIHRSAGVPLVIKDSIFTSNTWSRGVLQFINTNSNTTFSRTEISNNIGVTPTATAYPSIVAFTPSTAYVTIDHCNITNNRGYSGSAFACQNCAGSLEVTDSTISDNLASGGGGGGLYVNGMASIKIARTVFTNNTNALTSNSIGGALCYMGSSSTTSTVEIVDSTFKGNQVLNGGGWGAGMYMIGSTTAITNTTISRCTFSQNAAFSGGAIYFNTNTTLNIFNSVFTGNNASSIGGAIATKTNAMITGSTFKDNISGAGSALYTQIGPGSLSVTNSQFIGNIATTSSAGNGGAIFLSGSFSCLIDSCSLVNNSVTTSAGTGAGILSSATGALRITNSTFRSNTVLFQGGALNIQANPSVQVDNSIFDGNSAASGGVLFAKTSTFSFSKVTFRNNYASAGGVVAMQASGAVKLDMDQCTLSNNFAGAEGGVLSVSGTGSTTLTLSVSGSLFDGNFAPKGGVLCLRDATITANISVSSSTFSNNIATSDGGGAINSNSVPLILTIKNTVFSNNAATLEGGAISLNLGSAFASLSGQIGPGVNFTGNSATRGGGLIIRYLNSSAFSLKQLAFTSNIATQEGGAGIQIEDSLVPLSFSSFNFVGNKATGETGSGAGGALAILRAKSLTITGSTFISNEGLLGAVMSISDLDFISLSTLTTTGNKDGSSGAIYLEKTPICLVENFDLLGNEGSLLYFGVVSNVTLRNLAISGNSQNSLDLQGLGKPLISFSSSFTGSAIISSLSIIGNSAPLGSVFSIDGSATVSITNITMAFNTAPAISIKGTSAVELKGSSFVSNSGGSHSTSEISLLSIDQQASLNLLGCEITGNSFETLWNHASSSQSQISNIDFLDNHFTGAGFLSSSGITTLENITFVPNSAYDPSTRGSCFSLSNSAAITINNATIQGCASTSAQALIAAVDSSSISISNSRISSGGVSFESSIKLQQAVQFSMSNSVVSNFGSSFLFLTGSTVQASIQNSQFSNMYALSFDGAFVHLERGAKGIISDCSFIGATGTCFTIDSATLEMENSTVAYCNSSLDGGALRATGKPVISIANVQFSNNQASRGGAFILNALNSSHIVCEDCTFTNNSAVSGGAIFADYNDGNNVAFIRSSFLWNSASTYGGVASCSSSSEASFFQCSFENNHAKYGGLGFLDWFSKLDLDSCSLQNNNASSGGNFLVEKAASLSLTDSTVIGGGTEGDGGLAFLTFENQISIIRCTISGLSAANGGVLATKDSSEVSVLIVNSSFTGNTASQNGGALSLTLLLSDSLTVINSAFIRNEAQNGGAIYITNSANPPTLQNVTYLDNDAKKIQDDFYSPPKNLTSSVYTIFHNAGDQLPQITVRPLDFLGLPYDGELVNPLVLFLTIKSFSEETAGAYLAGNTQTTVRNGIATFSAAGDKIKMYGVPGNYALVVSTSISDTFYSFSQFSIPINLTINVCDANKLYFLTSDLACEKAICDGCKTEYGARCVAAGNCSCADATYNSDKLTPVEGLYCELVKDAYDSIKLGLSATEYPVNIENRDKILALVIALYQDGARSQSQNYTVKFRDFYPSGNRSIFKYGIYSNRGFVEGEALIELANRALIYFNLSTYSSENSEVVESSSATYLQYSDTIVIVLIAVSFLMSVVALFFGVVFARYKDTPVIKSTSPLFCFFVIFGIIFSYTTFLPFVGKPTAASCATPVVMFPLAFCFIFGNLFAKTFRIYRIFTNRKMRAVAPKNSVLLSYSGAMLAVELVLIIIWLAIGAPKPAKAGDETNRYWTCSSPNKAGIVITALLLIFNGAILVFGVFLAVQTRKAFSAYRESQLIGFIIYSMAVAGCVVLPVLYTIELDLVTSFAIRSITIFFITTVVLLMLFGPKVFVIFFKSKQNSSDFVEGQPSSSFGAPMQVRRGKQFENDSQNSVSSKPFVHTGWVLVKEKGLFTKWTKKYAVHYGEYFGFYDDEKCIEPHGAPSPIQHWKIEKEDTRLSLSLGKKGWYMETTTSDDIDRWQEALLKPFGRSSSRDLLAGHEDSSLNLKEMNTSVH